MIGTLLSPLATPTRTLPTATPLLPTATRIPHTPTPMPTISTPSPPTVFMLGFHSTAANWDAFWVTFWSTAIVTVIVGGAITYLITFFVGRRLGQIEQENEERRSRIEQENEERRLCRQYEGELALFQAQLRAAFIRLEPDSVPWEERLSLNIGEVVTLIDNQDRIALWQEMLEISEFVSALRMCQATYAEHMAAAATLRRSLDWTIEEYARALGDASERNAGGPSLNSLVAATVLPEQRKQIHDYCVMRAGGTDEAPAVRSFGLKGTTLDRAHDVYKRMQRYHQADLDNYRAYNKRAYLAGLAVQKMLLPQGIIMGQVHRV